MYTAWLPFVRHTGTRARAWPLHPQLPYGVVDDVAVAARVAGAAHHDGGVRVVVRRVHVDLQQWCGNTVNEVKTEAGVW